MSYNLCKVMQLAKTIAKGTRVSDCKAMIFATVMHGSEILSPSPAIGQLTAKDGFTTFQDQLEREGQYFMAYE